MKSNKLFLYVAASALFASCSDSDLVEKTEGIQTDLGKMVRATAISGSREVNNETRAYAPNGGFVWMPTKLGTSGEVLSNSNQRIGLCWTGFDPNGLGAFNSQDEVTDNVFTNYEFEHVGWLDESATRVWKDQCTTGDKKMDNAAYIVGFGATSDYEAKFGGTYKDGVQGGSPRWNGYYYGKNSVDGNLYGTWTPQVSYVDGKYNTGNLNLGSGVFETKNASVFVGQYLVYFPYTDQFTKGPIVASEPKAFTVDPTVGVAGTSISANNTDIYQNASDWTFCLGKIDSYEGGTAATTFVSEPFAGWVDIKIGNWTNSTTAPSDKTLKTVVLYSPNQGIIYKSGISAKEAISAINNNSLKTSDIYVGTPTKTNAVYANYTSNKTFTGEKLSSGKNNYQHLILPVLPQEISDLQIILIADDDKTIFVNAKDKKIVSKEYAVTEINLADYTFGAEYVAVDEPTFASALNNANAGSVSNVNIRLLTDIEMVKANDSKYADAGVLSYNKTININSDANANAGLILKSGVERTAAAKAAYSTLNINVPVTVEGNGCCVKTIATLNVGGTSKSTSNDAVNFNNTVYNFGTTNVGGDTKSAVVNFKTINNSYDDIYKYADGKTYVEKLGYSKRGAWARNRVNHDNIATVNGNGYFYVTAPTTGTTKFTAVNINNDAFVNLQGTAAASRNVDVKVTDIVNNGLKQYGVTTVTNINQVVGGTLTVGQKVEVNVENTITNNTNLAAIDVIGDGNSTTTDGHITIKNAGSSKNEGTIDNTGVIDLVGGSLPNSGIFVDRLTGHVGGIKVNNGAEANHAHPLPNVKYVHGVQAQDYTYKTDRRENGIYVSQTNTTERLAWAVNDPVEGGSATIFDFLAPASTPYIYDFKNIPNSKDLAGYDVRINIGAANTVVFQNSTMGGTPSKIIGKSTIAHDLNIVSGTLQIDKIAEATVQEDVYVEKNSKLVVNEDVNKLTVKDNMYLEAASSTVTVNSATGKHTDVVIEGTLDMYGTFTSGAGSLAMNTSLEVQKNVEIRANGLLDVNGDVNKFGKAPAIDASEFNIYANGHATFADDTNSTIYGTFNSKDASAEFLRESTLGIYHRATVNCGKLGDTYGTHIGGWPTEM